MLDYQLLTTEAQKPLSDLGCIENSIYIDDVSQSPYTVPNTITHVVVSGNAKEELVIQLPTITTRETPIKVSCVDSDAKVIIKCGGSDQMLTSNCGGAFIGHNKEYIFRFPTSVILYPTVETGVATKKWAMITAGDGLNYERTIIREQFINSLSSTWRELPTNVGTVSFLSDSLDGGGVVVMTTGGDILDEVAIDNNDTTWCYPNRTLAKRCSFKLASTTNSRFVSGFKYTGVNLDAYGVWLEYDSSSGIANWVLRGANDALGAGGTTTINTGIPADTAWHTMNLYVYNERHAELWMDNALIAELDYSTDYIPTINLQPYITIQTLTSATKTLYMRNLIISSAMGPHV